MSKYPEAVRALTRLEAFANQFAASLNNDAAELAFRAYFRVMLETVALLLDTFEPNTQAVRSQEVVSQSEPQDDGA